MKKVVIVELMRPARKDGGDRYETSDSLLVIYIPQHISRPDVAKVGQHSNMPLSKIKITFED